MKIIGLTGNSGSGKSLIAAYLKEKYAAYIIDADKIGHNIILKGTDAYNEIIDYFGNEILDFEHNIIRAKLGEIVFNDEKKLKKLSEITHYYICKEIMAEVNDKRQDNLYTSIIIDAPLLLETKLKDDVDYIWVVVADYETRLERLLSRDDISEKRIKERLDAQWTNEDYAQYADLIIENSSDFGKTKRFCDEQYEKMILN